VRPRPAATDAAARLLLLCATKTNNKTSKSPYSGQGPIKKTKRWSLSVRLRPAVEPWRWVTRPAQGAESGCSVQSGPCGRIRVPAPGPYAGRHRLVLAIRAPRLDGTHRLDRLDRPVPTCGATNWQPALDKSKRPRARDRRWGCR